MLTKEKIESLEQEAKMREIYDLRVYVVGGGFQYSKMFFDAGLKGARSVEDASIICFTGGSDVHPSLYEEKMLPSTFSDLPRDEREAGIYGEALALKKPMVGICRGAQFLNVMNGGKLWQDVDNHAIRDGHAVIDVRTGDIRENMTSTHHQQMIAADDAEIIATACRSTYKASDTKTIRRAEPENDDMEVLWYPGSLSLCFQPHPEFNHGDCRDYFLDLFDNYILPAC